MELNCSEYDKLVANAMLSAISDEKLIQIKQGINGGIGEVLLQRFEI